MAITNKARGNAYIKLYKAVAAYVRAQGGLVIVVGGIQVQEWPGDREGQFTIAVKCTGVKPIYSEKKKAEK
jgi:hypothetical protein